ncbi:MAG: TonB-dependent receptor [Bacteroidales bacterium]|jgi:hypothetical protein
MKFIIALVIFSFTSLIAFSQEEEEDAYQTVKGKVVDKDSKTPLWGVGVIIVGSSPLLGGVTDSSGYFTINNVPVGRQTVKASYIGYTDVLMQNVNVTSEKDISLNVQMTESVSSMKEVTVTAKIDKDKALNSMATVSARSFSIDEAERYAGGITDPSRMAQAYAGVAGTSNDDNEIVVRGNSPRGLLWRVEGIEVPNPNHWQEDEGGTGGGVCVLSSNVIGNSDFYTSAWPAEYGNALSGIFDINLRKGSDEYLQSSITASDVGTEISLEGPLYKQRESSFLINYRYSTFGLLRDAGIKVSNENIIPTFQDLTFNVSLPSNSLGHTTIFGVFGTSSSGIEPIENLDSLERDRNNRYYEFDQGNVWIAGITNTYLAFNKKTSFKTVLAVMGDDNKMKNDTMDNNFSEHNIYNENLDYITLRGAFTLNHKFNAKNTMRAGIIFSDEFYNLQSGGFDFNTDTTRTVFNTQGNTYVAQGFVEWKNRISNKITMTYGVHYLHLFLNNDNSLEPRAGITWQVDDKHSFSLGAGLHSRIEPLSVYLTSTDIHEDYNTNNLANKNIGLSKSIHVVLGYDYSFSDAMHLKAEAYFQHLYNVPVGIPDTGKTNENNAQFSVLNQSYGFVTMPLENKGTGMNTGIDITFERYFVNAYYFMLTGSLYDSRYTPADGKTYNSAYDGNYIFNALVGKEWTFGAKKNKTLGVNVRFLFRGGLRYQGLDLAKSDSLKMAIYNPNENYTLEEPAVYNIDMGINYKRNKKKYSWIVELDIDNLTNQQAVDALKYNVYERAYKPTYDLRLLPILMVKLNF